MKAGTFAPGSLSDSTGKGNTCDDANDPNGCIFTQNLLVPDATAAEIDAAVGSAASSASSNETAVATSSDSNEATASAAATGAASVSTSC